MAMTVSDILMDADVFRRAYPNWPHPEPACSHALLAAWLEQEGITPAADASEVAGRIADAAGARLPRWFRDGTGSQELRDVAAGIAGLHKLGDAGWAAENYWHGHDPKGN